MEKEINLPSVGGYHFGAMIDLSKYSGSYFEYKTDESNIINKAIIISLIYKPDYIYNNTDGYAGNCWTAVILDSRLIDVINVYKLNFRNFSDLVKHFESQDMIFVDKNNIYKNNLNTF